ncbi:type VI secretion system tip protein VgrG [Candidatus Brocadia pituitae]|nr:type VI secretion system tip protein VgrG [Candidatus Brocadia pituitae]
MPYTQDNRLIAIETPLGKDALLLTGFHGTEGLSTPFSFELDLLSENHSIPFTDIIGKNVAVSVLLTHGKRYFHGLISRFSQGRGGGEAGSDPRFSYYSATMVPWLWLLTKTADSRIFQNLSVPDIVEKIFQEKGFLDFKNKLQGSYDTWDYCVQYRETDFNFVSRLLEEEGIYYFFEHENNKHTLILADTPEEHKPCPKQETARYQISAGGWLEEDTISSLEIMQEITAGKYTLKDFNFETPNTDLKIEAPSQKALGPGEREIYDYPGGYGKRNRGDTLANVRMQEVEAGVTTITGSGECRAFTSGYKFDLKDYYRKDMNNKAYVLTSLGHSARQGYATEDAISEFSYANNFTCIPFEIPYRSLRRTPKPVVEGVQTAIVVGPAGEEIYTDEHGRVKVQFHWDREGKKDDKSSCWIRVSQVHAGKGFGGIDIPRIGEEVIIDFLEGDPDCPIITGRVYNGNNKPPTGLPSAGMVSGLKSNSTPGGGGDNTIMLDDTKGKEKITIHGQYNMDTTVDNDQSNTIGNNRTTSVGVNDSESVGADQSITVGGNRTEAVSGTETITIGGHRTKTVGGGETITVQGVETTTITAAEVHSVGAGRMHNVGAGEAIEVGGAQMVSVGGAQMVSVGGIQKVNVGALQSVSVGGSHKLSAAAISQTSKGPFKIKAGAVCTIEAPTIILKAGGSKIIMNSGGITIKGAKVTVKGDGKVTINGGGGIKLKGPAIGEN